MLKYLVKKLKEYINLQIDTNQSKNLFHKNFPEMMSVPLLPFEIIQNSKTIADDELQLLIDYTMEKVLQEFCRVNQYFSFSKNDLVVLKTMYQNLYRNIKEKEISADDIFKHHFVKLKQWLEKTNPFAGKMYRQHEAVLEAVACSEYNSELQKEILVLKDIELLEPVLDIGCGKNGSLVKSLIADHIEAYGIDRFSNTSPCFEKADWLTYDYGFKKWGTVVSNLGFSNHFAHHHLRKDGDIIRYAQKYMDILRSLKTGGCFCYAPDLPFIEKYLDGKEFSITKYDIVDVPFKTTVIVRLN